MKRVMCALLTVALLLGVAVLSVSASAIVYGDADGNGKINNRDLGMLQKHLNDDDVTINLTAMDVDNNGRVNNRDLGLLQKYLNDDDVTLGPEEPDTPEPPAPPVEPDVPAAALPAVGYDFDGRERIRIDAIVQDGYDVTVTVHNYSDKWMTEETACVAYTCTDAEGNVLTLEGNKYYGVLYFGMLEAGDINTYTITLPEGTAKLEFGESRIISWSQWA